MPDAIGFGKNIADYIKKRKWTLIWVISFIAATVFLVWRAPYYSCRNDEGAFLAIPYRLSMGDAMIKHEWHLSQLADILVYPIFIIYNWLTNGVTEGIFLNFRYISIVLRCFVCIYLFIRIKRAFSPMAALFSSLCPMLGLTFLPFVVSTVQYDINGCLLLMLCLVTIATVKNEKSVIDWLFSGLCFACAVLTCPLYILAWMLFMILCAVVDCKRRRGYKTENEVLKLLSLRNGMLFTCGCAVAAVPFLLFLLSRASISEIFEFLPIIMSDPDHAQMEFFEKTRLLVTAFFAEKPIGGKVLCLLIAIACFFGIRQFCCRRSINERHQTIYLYAYFFLTVLAVYMFSFYWLYVTIPVLMTGMLPYFMVKKKNEPMFYFVYCGSLLFSVLRYYTSNMRNDTLKFNMCIAAIAIFVFIAQLIAENRSALIGAGRRIGLFLITLIPIFLFAISVYTMLTISHDAIDCDPSRINVRMTRGPLKGLIVSQERHDYCEALYRETAPIREAEQGPVLFFGDDTWLWLTQKNEFGTANAWMIMTPEYNPIGYMERLKTYYEYFPEKKPRWIYVSSKSSFMKACFDPEQFVAFFGLEDADITKSENGYLINASALLDR